MKPPHKPIRNLQDLTKVWRFIDGGHGYSAPQLFALLIDAEGLVAPGLSDTDRRWVRLVAHAS